MAGNTDESARGGATRPWYREGLRFECQPDCGACCINHGNYAYVYLEDEEVEGLADSLDLKRDEFLARYTSLDDGLVILRMDEPACPFLDGLRCGVYPVRPTQCRTFPFWHENLRSRHRWSRLGEFCPGIDRGEVHPLRIIREHLAAHDDDDDD